MNLRSGFLCLASLCGATLVQAQNAPGPGAKPATEMPSVLTVPPEAQASPHFSAEAATDAYLAQIPAEATARSNAYFEGGYWLILWDFLMGVIIYIVLLRFRWSAAMRDFGERLTRFKPLQTLLLDGIFHPYLRSRLSSRGLRGIFSGTEIWPGDANLWPVDG